MTTTQSWLELAEKERAEKDAQRDRLAAELAKEINTCLAELGITPLTPARTDGEGNLIPAQLTEANQEKQHYIVYADYDEDEGEVSLLVGDYRAKGFREFLEPRPTGYTLSGRDAAGARSVILYVREKGPLPPRPEQPSADTHAIVAVLRDIHAALDNIARAVGRP